MNKIYALYVNENKYEMKISCEKHWENQRNFVEKGSDVIKRWNDCIFLSFSRSTLVEKASEIKKEWLQKQYEIISKIADINLK
ncbi:MAG: hypothetical protein IJA34_00410 [Lachnospiraceae bacterium]|nr:hypothetical protein [Lachnospiraceae bacterium]